MPISDEEVAFLDMLSQSRKSIPTHVNLICQGDRFRAVYILLNGWAVKHRMTSDGECQVINFILPGSFFCFGAEVFERCNYTVTSLTPAVYAICDVKAMMMMRQQFPQLAIAVNWIEKRENAMLIEHMVSLGRRSAEGAVAHLLLELHSRLNMCSTDGNKEFIMPLTQEIMGDALGLTTVHINRMLRRLKNKGLIDIQHHSPCKVKFLNVDALKKIAGFDSDYLNFTQMPHKTRAALASLRSEAPTRPLRAHNHPV